MGRKAGESTGRGGRPGRDGRDPSASRSAIPDLAERRELDQDVARRRVAGAGEHLGELARVALGHQPQCGAPPVTQRDPRAALEFDHLSHEVEVGVVPEGGVPARPETQN